MLDAIRDGIGFRVGRVLVDLSPWIGLFCLLAGFIVFNEIRERVKRRMRWLNRNPGKTAPPS